MIGLFRIDGELLGAERFGGGHINDSFVSTWTQSAASRPGAGSLRRYLHQRINETVFARPDQVMDNILRVTGHLAGKTDDSRRCLRVARAQSGEAWVRDAQGGWWRSYIYIEGTRSFEKAGTPFQARQAGAIVGLFQKDLVDLPPPRLYETIPAFHDMEARYRAFDAALARDRENRAAGVSREIGFMLDNRERGSVLIRALREGRIPERICHNDAKIGNILFDADANAEPAPGATPCPDTGGPGAGGEALCLVDLDTVMPGTPLFDLGDLIRTVPALTEEDDPDLSAAGIDLIRYEALLEGYLSQASSFLTAAERELLAESGRNLTQIMGLRFLTDYLDGDRYYRRTRPGQNLDRCRNQIALIEAMDANWAELEAIVSCIADC